jgi:phage terminase small subunit
VRAAAAVGYSGRQIRNAGWKVLRKPQVRHLLAERAQEVAEQAEMSTATWAAELRAIAFSSVGDIIAPDGQLIPVALLPRHVQAAISSVKVTPDGKVIEYKFWDKPGALQTMARHLGLFERDNTQKVAPVLVKIELVG